MINMVCQRQVLTLENTGSTTIYKEIKGPLLLFGVISSLPSNTTAIYVGSPYAWPSTKYDFALNLSVIPAIIFSEPVYYEDLTIAFYKSDAGSASCKVCLLYKNISKVK